MREKKIVIIGATGNLGSQLLSTAPQSTSCVTLSRGPSPTHPLVKTHIQLDLRTSSPETVIGSLYAQAPDADAFIYLAYDKHFSAVEDMGSRRFAEQVYLNVSLPVILAQWWARQSWSLYPREENLARNKQVVLVSSASSFRMDARRKMATYAATKSALNCLSEYLGDALFRDYGVRTHLVIPGTFSKNDILARTANTIFEHLERPTGTEVGFHRSIIT